MGTTTNNRGLDTLALDRDWGEVRGDLMPADVVAAANEGRPLRRPAPGEIARLRTAAQRIAREERLRRG